MSVGLVIKENVITDFELGSERFSSIGQLEYNDLIFAGDIIQAGDELLTTLDDVGAAQLSDDDFTPINKNVERLIFEVNQG